MVDDITSIAKDIASIQTAVGGIEKNHGERLKKIETTVDDLSKSFVKLNGDQDVISNRIVNVHQRCQENIVRTAKEFRDNLERLQASTEDDMSAIESNTGEQIQGVEKRVKAAEDWNAKVQRWIIIALAACFLSTFIDLEIIDMEKLREFFGWAEKVSVVSVESALENDEEEEQA